MPVIGTAGHVDHGKSTLVMALTGRDPDRWQEEKERGLTIDLGFAWTRLGEEDVSFVDVPGHQRFIKNMLAGTDGFDVALLVVAADEGWMPQSEEHLAVLDLLGIGHGVVALTKIDRADRDLVELAVLEVGERLAGTSLAGSAVVPVSAVTGEGLDEVRAALAEALRACPVRDTGRPRLWVDRSFTIAGAGTVVTGTLVDGSLEVGGRIEIYPGGREGRIRSLQSHERSRDRVPAGTRTAVGVVGLSRENVARGDMLGRPGEWMPNERSLVSLRRARYVEKPLSRRGAYQMHLGSGAWPVTLHPAGPLEIDGRTEEAAVLRLDRPAPMKMGDRFVLREVGRRLIVAGGRVLEPLAPHDRPANAAGLLRKAVDASPGERAAALLEVRGMERAVALAAHSGGGEPASGVAAGEVFLSASRMERLQEAAREAVERFHRENPLRPGLPKASLATRLGVNSEVLAVLLEREGALEERDSVVAAADFRADLGEAGAAEEQRIRLALEESGLQVPRLTELDADPEIIHALVRQGRLVRISDDLVYLPGQIDSLLERLDELPEPFTVADFRDTMGLTRKYAVPLLEWMDRTGVTTRRGNDRQVTCRL